MNAAQTNTPQTPEQRRAAFAYKCIEQARKHPGSMLHYKTFAVDLPVMLLKNGIGQALAFLASKAAADEGHAAHAARALLRDVARYAAPRLGTQTLDVRQLIESLLTADPPRYRRCEHEIAALAVWLKRFAEAFLVEAQQGKDGEHA